MDKTTFKIGFGCMLFAVAFTNLLSGAQTKQQASAVCDDFPNTNTQVIDEVYENQDEIVTDAESTTENEEYTEPVEDNVPMTLEELYPAVYENDGFTMLTYVVSHEVGNCSYESKKAVAHTVLNRIASPEFPNTAWEVLNVPGQYDAIWDSYYCGQFVPSEDTIAACEEALWEWDFTLGATYYYNPNITGYLDWFESLQICYVDSNGQRFFKAW